MSRREATGQGGKDRGPETPLPCLNFWDPVSDSWSRSPGRGLAAFAVLFPFPITPLLPKICPPEDVTQWPEEGQAGFCSCV